MAVVIMKEGDLEIQIKDISRLNTASLIADGTLDATDYPVIKGGITEFRLIMDVVFAQFDTDVTVTVVTLTGKSWPKLRDQVRANFNAVDAVINP